MDGKGGLSQSSVRQAHAVLHKALRCAMKWGFVFRNVGDATEPPRARSKEPSVPNEATVAKLIGSLGDSRLQAPTLVAVATGLRRGELLGLTWANIDFANGAVSVIRSLEETNEAGLVLAETKTKSSRRVVAVPRSVMDSLRRHKVRQGELRLALGPAYQDSDLVFPAEDGSFWRPSTFSREFAKAVSNAGLNMRFHDLRHACATILMRQGVHPKIVSERLGHSTVGITLNLYSHVTPDMQREAADQLEKSCQGFDLVRRCSV